MKPNMIGFVCGISVPGIVPGFLVVLMLLKFHKRIDNKDWKRRCDVKHLDVKPILRASFALRRFCEGNNRRSGDKYGVKN